MSAAAHPFESACYVCGRSEGWRGHQGRTWVPQHLRRQEPRALDSADLEATAGRPHFHEPTLTCAECARQQDDAAHG